MIHRRVATIAVALMLAVVAACGGSSSPTVERGVVFTEGLAADLYRPAGRPRDGTAVVLVHGGGFSDGDRSQAAGYAEALVKRGWFAAAVDYRLSEGQWFPATTLVQPGLPEAAAKARDDVLTFVAWLRDHARQYGLLPGRIVLAGYSAGGITVIEAARVDREVLGAFALAGAAVEPSTLTTGISPLYLMHGDADTVIPIGLAEQTCAAATAVTVPCRLERVGGVGHEIGTTRFDDVVNRIDAFAADPVALVTAVA